ncbi:substrate-binding periplasmic protein [Thalassotalea sediminis]|uniref:substrate-binding periplasmic protein n=1 Tax=Thalassotalea sediminis TaxID=1759089 RepID=UPI0025731C21|nr:transporter substrate-binding domain-containing protein [Thalassotalea sediminis]
MRLLLIVLWLISTEALSVDQVDKTRCYKFASIENLIEQELGRLILPVIYRNLGIDIIVTPLPAERAQYLANAGIKDGEIMRIWSYGEENPNVIRVPTPYYYLETMPFILRNSKVSINQVEDLINYRIAKVRGVKHTNNITKGLHKVSNTNSTKNMFMLLNNGVVDIAITNTIDGVLNAEKMGYKDIIPLDEPLAVKPLYHYIHKRHKGLVELVDNEIKRLQENGELKRLIEQAEKKLAHE